MKKNLKTIIATLILASLATAMQASGPTSSYSAMTLTNGAFNGTALRLINNNQWRGILTLPIPVPNPAFSIQGTGTNTATWGDSSASATSTPIFSTAVTGQPPITLSGTWSNHFVLAFNNSTGLYNLRQTYYQNFSGFTATNSFTPGAVITNSGWTTLNTTIFNTNGAFNSNTLRLGGPAATGLSSYVQSPVITGGIGSIGFYYRSLDESGSQPGQLDIRLRSSAVTNWATIGSVTNILTTNYLFHETGYASAASNVEIRLSWDSTNNPAAALIAVDDLTIERLSCFTSISNVTHTPLTPAFTNNVTISASITPSNAANLSAALWYRLGTSGTFAVATLTNTTGNTYTTALPHTAPGPVQYYVKTTFTSPQGEGPFTVTAPTAGPLAPLAFTNSEALAAYTKGTPAQGWGAAPAPSSYTNAAGWIRNDGFVKGRTFTVGAPQAIWLNNLQPDSTFLQTPLLPFGVGVINMENSLNTAGNAKIDVLVSTNGVDNWLSVYTLELTTNAWGYTTIPLNITTSLYLRFMYNDVPNAHVGFDNVSITYPLATVAISNMAFHPYYPASTEPVHITCGISSSTAFSPAFDITARVYYKVSTTTNWSEPIEMTGNGNSFITRSPIPPYPSGTTVNYYIKSTFKGYSSFYSYTPTRSPENPDTAPHSYTTRTYSSSYNTLNFGIGGATGGMSRVSDNQWEGLMQFGSPTNHPEFLILGYGYYDGTNIGGGLSTTWGDDSTTRTNLPLAGVAEADGIPITIPEMAQGQYLVIFNEISRQYAVQRVAFENFDQWPASDTLFEESFNAARITTYTNNFDVWNLSSLNPQTDVFEAGWTNGAAAYPFTGSFPPTMEAQTPAGFFKLFDGVIVTQRVGSAAMLINNPLSGEVRSTVPASIGTISFDARCASPSDFRPAIYDQLVESNVMVTATIQATDLPISSSTNSLGYAHKSIYVNYVDPNNYYELRMQQANTTQKSLELWKNTAGALTLKGAYLNSGSITNNDTFSLLLFKSGTTNMLRAFLSNLPTPRVTFNDTTLLPSPSTFIGLNGMDVSLAVDSVSVYGVTNASYDPSSNIYTEGFDSGTASNWTTGGGVWTVTNNAFCRPGYTGAALSLDIDTSLDQVSWTTATSYSNLTQSAYRTFTATPRNATNIYMRVRHKNGNGLLIVDNMRSEVWRGEKIATNNWMATNVWVTAGQSGRGLELRGSRALGGQQQYIQSPVISNGVAVIAFDYTSITGASNLPSFAIAYTRTNAVTTWFPLTAVTNNPTNWVNYSLSVDRELRPQIYRVGIFNSSTNPAAGLLLDNIVITEPAPIDDYSWWGYNVLITDKQQSKLATNITGNIKGAYLNNSQTNGTGTDGGSNLIAYTSYYPSIQSARLPDGIGEISFWYRGWDGSSNTIEIVAATNRLQPDAQWTPLDNVSVTNTTFTLYRQFFYDVTNRYIKLRVPPGIPGRAAIDNLRILAPFASDLRMKNLKLIPEIPLFTDDVLVQVEVDDMFFAPSNITLRLYFKQGTSDWGQYSTSDFDLKPVSTNGDTVTYRTFTPIGARTIDTVIQYQVEATFDGFFTTGHTSPKRYSSFENPDHYWPVDLNHDQPYSTPYYYTLSCLPGQVWINEFNVADGFFSTPGPQYIEVGGKGNTRIGNWRVEVINPTTYTTNAAYTIPADTVLGTISNSYGFYVLGDHTVTNRHTTLTNTLPDSAGIQLVRSMGAFEFQVSYDVESAYPRMGEEMSLSPDHRFVYAGVEDNYYDSYPLSMIGSGSNSAYFGTNWAADVGDFSTIGTTNIGQTLIPWPNTTPDPDPPTNYTGTATIDRAWRSGAQIVMELSTQSTNLTPKAWYATNLINSTWHHTPSAEWLPASALSWSRTGTLYNVTCTAITNVPGVFYAVTVTGTD